MSSTTLRHRIALVGLIAGPLLLTLDDLIQPAVGDGARRMADAVAASPDRFLLGWTTALIGAALLIPGLAALSARVGNRRAGLFTFGLALTGAGAVGLVGLAASNLVLAPLVGSDPASAVPSIERMNESTALAVVFALYLPGVFLGVPLLFGGLVRAGVAPWWTLAAAVGSSLVGVLGSGLIAESDAVQGVLRLAAFAGVLAHRPEPSATEAAAVHPVEGARLAE